MATKKFLDKNGLEYYHSKLKTELSAKSNISDVAMVFNTVADMQSSENLRSGDRVKTLGFRYAGDGGGAYYIISDTGTANGMDVISVGNLYASLTTDAIYIPEQFGAYKDGTVDASTVFARIFSIMGDNSRLEMSGKYLIGAPLYLPNKNNIVITGGTLKAADTLSGYVLNSNLTSRVGPSGYSFKTENMSITDVFIDCNYSADGIYLDGYVRAKISRCTIHNPATCGISCNNGHEAILTSTSIIGRSYGHDDNTIASTGIVLNCHDNIVSDCVIAYCKWAIEVNSSFNQISNSHFYCNLNSGGNIKVNNAPYVNLTGNYYDGSGVYAIAPWMLTVSDSLFLVSDATNHIIELELPNASTDVRGVYINNSQINDVRSSKPDYEFIKCNRKPHAHSDCYIGDIYMPTNIVLSNLYNIFALKNSTAPMIIMDSFFRATVNNSTGAMGAHGTTEDVYTYKFNGNYIESTFVGASTNYAWLFFEVFVPEKARIKREVLEVGTGQGNIAIYDSNETFLGYDEATVEPGKYYVGVYRNAKIIISNM